MKRIKFTGFGANSAIGGFGPGDTASVSDEMAEHFVNEAKVARYLEATAPAQSAQTQQATSATAKRGKPQTGTT